MLGQSVVIIGLPAVVGASFGALRAAPDRAFALAAVAISLLEALGLVVFLALTVLGVI